MPFISWPPVGVVSRHLPHRRGLALGLVIGGSSLGGIIWPITLDKLLNYHHVSFGWTMRIFGFITLPCLLIACFTVREAPRVATTPALAPASSDADETTNPVTDTPAIEASEKPSDQPASGVLAMLKSKTFIYLAIGLAIGYLGMFAPFFYVSSYASQLGQPSDVSFSMISAINAASFVGRVVPGHIADTYGHYNILILALFTSGVVGFCWTAIVNLAGLVIWSLAYGFTSGVCLPRVASPARWKTVFAKYL